VQNKFRQAHTKVFAVLVTIPVTSLGHQEGQRVFWNGPKFFELFPIVLNYFQHIFPEGAKKFF